MGHPYTAYVSTVFMDGPLSVLKKFLDAIEAVYVKIGI